MFTAVLAYHRIQPCGTAQKGQAGPDMRMRKSGRRGPVRICLMGLAAAGMVWGAVYMIKNSRTILTAVPWEQQVRAAGERLAALLWRQAVPYEAVNGDFWKNMKCEDGNKRQKLNAVWADADPSFKRHMKARLFYREHQYLDQYGDETTGENQSGEPSGEASEKTAAMASSSALSLIGSLPLPVAGTLYQLQQLEDFDFLMKHFYSVHTSTTAGRDLFNGPELLNHDLTLSMEEEGPQILIYHTHSQEAFKDSAPQGQTIVEVGSYLAELLTQKGYRVYHDTTVYDLQNGVLDRSRAYNYALEGVNRILQQNPSIQVVLDLHRDGVAENLHLVSDINGKPTAQIMFFNGLSRTPEGEISYLPNPYLAENLAFSLKMQLGAQAYFPGFARKIYLKGLRYNLHLRPRSALIEAGAQTNTFDEVKNAMEPLAQLLDMVLQGE